MVDEEIHLADGVICLLLKRVLIYKLIHISGPENLPTKRIKDIWDEFLRKINQIINL